MATLLLNVKTVGARQAITDLGTLTRLAESLAAAFIEANLSLERTEVLLTGVTGSTQGSAEAMEYLVDMTTRAPFSINALTDSFTRLQIAGLDPMSGSLDTITNAISAFGGTSEDLKLSTIAIQQMAGKGVVSMEELRRQLSERVPSAIRDMAEGLGLSYGELVAKVGSGNQEATEAISAMLGVWEVKFEGSNKALRDTMAGTVSYMQSQWQVMLRDIGKQGVWDSMKEAVESMGQVFEELKVDQEFMSNMEMLSDSASELFSTLSDRSTIDAFISALINLSNTSVAVVKGFVAITKGVKDFLLVIEYMASSNYDPLAGLSYTEVLNDAEAVLEAINKRVTAEKEISKQLEDQNTSLKQQQADIINAEKLRIWQGDLGIEEGISETQLELGIDTSQTFKKIEELKEKISAIKDFMLEGDFGTEMITELENSLQHSTSFFKDKPVEVEVKISKEAQKKLEKDFLKIQQTINDTLNLSDMGEELFGEFKIWESYDKDIANMKSMEASSDQLADRLSQAGIELDLNSEKFAKNADEADNASKSVADMVSEIKSSSENLSGMSKYYAEIAAEAKKMAAAQLEAFDKKTPLEQAAAIQQIEQALLGADVASGKFRDTLIDAGKDSENMWAGFNSGLLEAIDNTMTLGQLGAELTGHFVDGLKGSLSAAFRGEFDDIKDIWKGTLDNMAKSLADWASGQVIEFGIEAIFGSESDISKELKSALGVGEAVDPMTPATFGAGGLNVNVTNMEEGGFGGGADGGFEAIKEASSYVSTLTTMFEQGSAWDDAGTSIANSFEDSMSGSSWIDDALDTSSAYSASSNFFGTGRDAYDAAGDRFFTGDTTDAWGAAMDEIDWASEFDSGLTKTNTLMDKLNTTWESVQPYVGAAAGAYGIYSGIEQGGVGGTLQAGGGAMSIYQAGVDAGLYEASGMIGTAGAALGTAGGLYGIYQGVESGNYVQAAGGAVQAYQGATTLAPEISTAISEGFGSLTGGLLGTTAASTAAATGGAYAATSAASAATQLAAAEGAATVGGAAMGAWAGPIGMAVAMAMNIYSSETEDKFKYESQYGEFEVAERGQDRGSALVRSMDTIMEDLALSVEAGASAVQFVPEDIAQRANQHLDVLWTEFGEGMAGMALAIDPTLTSFDQYVQATTNAKLSTEELTWLMERSTEAAFGNIDAVNSLEYQMERLGQSSVEASVSAAGMISAMAEASEGMTYAGQTYYTTLAQMANGTSDFDGTVRELQATLGITDNTVHDLSGTLQGQLGLLDEYGNTIERIGGESGEAMTQMEMFGAVIYGVAESTVNAMGMMNSAAGDLYAGTVFAGQSGPTGEYNKDGAVYSYHARGGVMNRPTVFHVGGEAGDEAIVPLHNGPETLKIMDEKIDAIANRPLLVNIIGDKNGLRRFIRVEADDLVTDKLQRDQGTERVEF